MSKRLIFVLTFILSIAAQLASGQTITGNLAICVGGSSALAGSLAGGTWSSSTVAVASINTSGLVTSTAAGTTTITYTDPTSAIATAVVTVNPVPAPITGGSSVCAGSSLSLSSASSGGSWISTNAVAGTINMSTGVVAGASAGTTTISYAYPATNCASTLVVTVNPLPAVITSGSTFSICNGESISLSSAPAGGVWSSSNASIAFANATTGVVTGASTGTTMIWYSLPTSCARSHAVTVNPTPSAISGPAMLCAGTNTTLTATPAGGAWSSSSTAVATINPATGLIAGITEGFTAVSYTLASGCTATLVVTVNAIPAPIGGSLGICLGDNTALTNATPSGIWTASTPAVATVSYLSGVVSSVSVGTSRITYTIPSGCASTAVVTVNSLPLPVSGPSSICIGAPEMFSSASPGGLWISGSTSIAILSTSTGSATTASGIATGSTAISYVTGPGCVASIAITVNPAPFAGSISGPAVICAGTPASLTATASGGVWTSSTPTIAAVSGTGLVTGFGLGVAIISYSVTNVCGTAVATMPVTINLMPAAISGSPTLCSGTTTTLADASAGGIWASSDPSIATISGTGVVNGLTGGISVISYSYSSACFVTRSVTVNTTPAAIMGISALCQGSVIALSDALAGGTWASSNPPVATIATVGSTTGVVTGVSGGTAIITYSMSTGCMVTAIVTVNTLPVITASATPASCGGTYLGVAGGGISYSWSPAVGLSCSTCGSTTINPVETTTYTITGIGVLGCENTATISVGGNRIYGTIAFSGPAPSSLGMKVWLIQYNAADSSINATDSMVTCLDGASPYYEFDNKTAGNYMVKARLLSSVAGTSGYIPTYGSSTSVWHEAAGIAHTSTSDHQNISMLYGIVPSGSGFVGGFIYSGAGRGTTGEVAVAGMLVYLKNALTGQVLTYTYTNAVGAYSFSNLAFGRYIVYPEDFSYYTTQSDTLTLNEGHTSETAVNFKQHTTLSTITPFTFAEGVAYVASNGNITTYPNPTAGSLNISWKNLAAGPATISITDVTGRKRLQRELIINAVTGTDMLDLQDMENGMYFLVMTRGESSYKGKIIVQKK